MSVQLKPIRRGDTFRRTFTLGNDWVNTMFADIKFTLRSKYPSTGTSTDDDAVAQATMSGGGITFAVGGVDGTILVHASQTTLWEPGLYVWDVQGHVAGAEPQVYTIDDGNLRVLPDVTRSV